MDSTKTATTSDGTGSPAPILELTPGDVIAERYAVEEILGRGGMGVVVAARHEVLGHRVAIKVLAKGKRADAEAFERFTREARIIASLESPHVVAVRDYGVHRGAPFMVMDLLAGRDLRRELELRGKLPLAEAIDHVIGVCDGLAAAHAKGIVHRDVKPANVFLATDRDGERTVIVLDFGVAKLAPAEGEIDLTRTDAAVGSPSYMSPEQIRDARAADARSDVWSLGVTLYKLLSDELPFRATSSSGMYAAIIADPPIPLRERVPEMPPEVEAIVLRCLEKTPSARFSSVGALALALAPHASPRGRALAQRLAPSDEHAASDAGTTSSAVTVAVEPPRRTARGSIAIAAALGVAIFVGGGYALVRARANATPSEATAAATSTQTATPTASIETSTPAAGSAVVAVSATTSARATDSAPRPRATARSTTTTRPPAAPPPSNATAKTIPSGFGGTALDGHL